MRRASALATALTLAHICVALVTAPAVATEEPTTQRVELPEIGLAAVFPAHWTVRAVMTPRESWFDVSAEDPTPVYAWSGFFAIGDEGRWCDLDRFEDFPWSLDEHATFLEHWHVSGSLYGRSGGYEAIALQAGPAWRIDVNDERKGRSSRLYLLEHEDDHILLTCSDILGSPEDWMAIADSIELGPRTASAPTTMAATLDAIHAD